MSENTMRTKMADELQGGVAATTYADIPIKFENQPFNQPKDSDWLSFFIVNIDAKRASIGTEARYRKHTGFITVECYARENSGTSKLNTYMDDVAEFFQERSFTLSDGEVVKTQTAKKKANVPYFGFTRGTVLIPFTRRSNT